MHKNIIKIPAIFTLFCLLLACCTNNKYLKKQEVESQRKAHMITNDILLGKSYEAANYLNKNLQRLNMKDKSILITTFSDNDNLESSNTLGRLIPYLIGSRLSQMGYKLVDIRLRDNDIEIKPGYGEFVLTRDLNKLKAAQPVGLILTGHYSKIKNKIYIHCEIISPTNNILISSYDFILPYTEEKGPKDFPIIIPSVRTS
ncbi:FlgO family outer membrane protein [Desulfothermus okinawensis]